MDTTRPSLLIRIRDHADQVAWSEFDAIYRPMLRRFGLARGLAQTEADEIAQVCMASISKYIGGFEYNPQKGRFKAWLRTMVNNRFKNLLRDRRDKQAESQDFKNAQEPGESPDELFDRLWRQEHLKHCLRLIRSEVEESTFKAFVAYVMEDRPVDHVCSEFGMKPNQVHAIKSRITKRLRERMFEVMGEDE